MNSPTKISRRCSQKKRVLLLILLFAWFCGVVFGPTHTTSAQTGSIWYAKPAAGGNCLTWGTACDLQTAIAQATAGDQIWVAAGTYYPTTSTNRTISFSLKNGVSVYGGFPASGGNWESRDWPAQATILSGNIGSAGINTDNSYHVVNATRLDASTVLDGFTITDGYANGNSPEEKGGGLSAYLSDMALTHLVITNNFASNAGAGLMINRSHPSLTDVEIRQNYAAGAGGGMFNYLSNPHLVDVSFINNSSGVYSGGMLNEISHPTLQSCTFTGNSTVDLGGGMYNEESNPSLNSVVFTENTAGHLGGGMANSASSPTLTDVTFLRNSAENGGGVANFLGTPLFQTTVFTDNSAKDGAGMYNEESEPTLQQVSFLHNTASGNGGGLYNLLGTIQITSTRFENNTATIAGGGMYSYQSTLHTQGLTFQNNSAESHGGGMANYHLPEATFTDLNASGNTAVRYGGAIFNDTSNPQISQASIRGNYADRGGGIYNDNANPSIHLTLIASNTGRIGAGIYNYSSSISVVSSTISANAAKLRGGGVANYDGSSATFQNVTIAFNTAGTGGTGGGFYNEDSSPVLTNTIIWGNSQGNLSGTSAFVTYSVIQGGYSGTGNLSADPLLGSLQDNGGFSHTHAIASGSPAIDAGSPALCPTTDQRGMPRPVDGNLDGTATCDIGGYEYTPLSLHLLFFPFILVD